MELVVKIASKIAYISGCVIGFASFVMIFYASAFDATFSFARGVGLLTTMTIGFSMAVAMSAELGIDKLENFVDRLDNKLKSKTSGSCTIEVEATNS